MTGEITVRARRPGDSAELARAWHDSGRYYAALAPDTFQAPATLSVQFFTELMGYDRRSVRLWKRL